MNVGEWTEGNVEGWEDGRKGGGVNCRCCEHTDPALQLVRDEDESKSV